MAPRNQTPFLGMIKLLVQIFGCHELQFREKIVHNKLFETLEMPPEHEDLFRIGPVFFNEKKQVECSNRRPTKKI